VRRRRRDHLSRACSIHPICALTRTFVPRPSRSGRRRRRSRCPHDRTVLPPIGVDCVERCGTGHSAHEERLHVYSPWRVAQHLDTFNEHTTMRARAESSFADALRRNACNVSR
jgi:hypothetical protein